MKALLILITVLGASFVQADQFDEKAAANQAAKDQAYWANARAKKNRELQENNRYMVGRVPRGATLTQCYDMGAFRYRARPNGCNLTTTSWNGVPMEVCTETYRGDYPPDIVECHYRLRDGRDCQIFRNGSIPPRCL